jgi:hypothetical protein
MTTAGEVRAVLDHIRSLSLSVPLAMNDAEGFYRSQVMEAIGTAQRAIDRFPANALLVTPKSLARTISSIDIWPFYDDSGSDAFNVAAYQQAIVASVAAAEDPENQE